MPIVPVKTYYLAMSAAPHSDYNYVPEKVSVVNWNPDTEQYLNMYNTVGKKWGWTGRSTIPQDELNKILKSTGTLLYLIKYNGDIAGFSELIVTNDEVELKYFGLLDNFLGKGIGGYFLCWNIEKAWSLNPNKVTVHTCEYDHPAALSIYRKYGFEIIKTQIDHEFYTDEFLKNRE